MVRGGLSRRLVGFADSLVGWLSSGRSLVSVPSRGFFAAISGSSVATAAAIDGLTCPEMEKRDYPKDYSAAVQAVGGAAWILFRKPPSVCEALNDLDRHLMNFYRVAKFHAEALVEEMAAPRRDLFHLLRDELNRPALTDIQRAAAYYFVQRYAFGGRPCRPTIGARAGRPVAIRAAVFRRAIPLVAERLKNVMLENLSWDRFVACYDKPDTFRFLDPPYMGHREHRHNFSPEDFDRLAAAPRSLKGRFLLTHSGTPETRRLFKNFKFTEVALDYTVQCQSGGQRKIGHELLIRNY